MFGFIKEKLKTIISDRGGTPWMHFKVWVPDWQNGYGKNIFPIDCDLKHIRTRTSTRKESIPSVMPQLCYLGCFSAHSCWLCHGVPLSDVLQDCSDRKNRISYSDVMESDIAAHAMDM